MRRKDNVKIYFAVCRPQDLSFYADNFVEKSGAGYSRSCSLPLFFRSSSSSFTRRGFQMKVFDTVPANQAAYAVALAPYGVSLSVEDFALHCNGRYYRDFLGELLGGDEAKIDAVHDAKLAAYPALFHRIRENTALFSLLQTLRADYHTALVTSATRCSVEAILRYFHRENCFDLLLTNVEVPHKKPAPDGFLMAMEHFGVAPADTIIFEDSPEGIQAAQASGAPYLLVREIR